jgi:hypothetical protein
MCLSAFPRFIRRYTRSRAFFLCISLPYREWLPISRVADALVMMSRRAGAVRFIVVGFVVLRNDLAPCASKTSIDAYCAASMVDHDHIALVILITIAWMGTGWHQPVVIHRVSLRTRKCFMHPFMINSYLCKQVLSAEAHLVIINSLSLQASFAY